MKVRIWLSLVDIVAACGWSGSKLWLWLICRAAEATYWRVERCKR